MALPEVGQTFGRGDQFGSVESVKAVSDLYCPVSGEVVEVNATLDTAPETVNQRPHETWMIVLKITNPSELSDLLDADGYAALIA